MTYGIIATLLLLIGIIWFIISGRADRSVDEMERVIVAGDEERLAVLLKNSPQVADSLNDVTYLLMKSVAYNRPSMVQELLGVGHRATDIQSCARDHEVDLLCSAIGEADAEVLRILLSAGMKESLEKYAPVQMCYMMGRPEHLRVLEMFDATGMTEEQNARKYTPLHAAAIRFSENPQVILPMVSALLQKGADVNALSSGGNTPMDMALDETHEGAGQTELLVDLLRAHGGTTGRILRVPQPMYDGAVYFSGSTPDCGAIELAEGVEIVACNESDTTLPANEELEACGLTPESLAALRKHRSYVLVRVKGKAGDDPLQVASKGLSVLVQLTNLPGMVGFRFEKNFIPTRDFIYSEEGEFNPMIYTSLKMAHTEDDYILVDTSGLSRFGLAEVELIINRKVLNKNKHLALGELIADLSTAAISGKTAWEAGHTATLRGMFCQIAYGKHSVTHNDGIVVIVAES